jgi:hypothetical protein
MSQKNRRMVVCFVWFAVGVMLIVRGLPYLGLMPSDAATRNFTPLHGSQVWIALAVAVALGLAKGFTLLRKGARRAARQIEDRGENAPFWSVFSPYMIVLVALMIGAGLAIRLTPYDPDIKGWVVGMLYPGIGLALIIGGLLALSVEPLRG